GDEGAGQQALPGLGVAGGVRLQAGRRAHRQRVDGAPAQARSAAVMTFEEVARHIRLNEVGRRACIETPFGRRLLCYADLTATGRYLHFVETWVRRLRPYYANTHTAISSTGRLMTDLREEARRVIE